jgi:ABC-type nitrate/sulfonate/bicarbonate transport system permease component
MAAYMPQSAAETLSPWLTVREEISLPLRIDGGHTDESKQAKLEELVRELGIEVPMDRNVRALSGGQRVKVALLRSFAVSDMKLFVLDEPFEGLDAGSRNLIINAIKDVSSRGTPVVLTSHRQKDLEAVGARIVRVVGSPIQRLSEVKHQKSLAPPVQGAPPESDPTSEGDALSRTTTTMSSSEDESQVGLLPLIGVVSGLALWKLISFLIADPGLIPGPLDVGAACVDLLVDRSKTIHFAATMFRSFFSWVVASLTSIPIGIFLGYDSRIYSAVSPWLSLGRTLPIFVLIGPSIGLFPGLPEIQRGFLIWLTLYLISLQSISAYSAFATRSRVRIARIFGASHSFCLRYVMPQECKPGIFSALEVTLPLSIIVTLVVEIFLIPDVGLGIYIFNHLTDSNLSMLIAHILLPGFVASFGMWLLRRRGSKEATVRG